MDKVITKDGSITYYNEEYDECYHSTSGAIEEAKRKFVEPCNIGELPRVSVLDIGFGLGYNVAAAIDASNGDINVVSLEKDKSVIELINGIDSQMKSYKYIKKLSKMKGDIIEYKDNRVHLKVIFGDARDVIAKIDTKFNCVFLDPFSPKKNSELWTESFLQNVMRLMTPNSILATYSCARIVRDNLRKVGFKVVDGPIVGRRSPGTLALVE